MLVIPSVSMIVACGGGGGGGNETVQQNNPTLSLNTQRSYSTLENLPIGLLIFKAKATASGVQDIVFSITPTDTFQIDPNSGEVRNRKVLDFETKTSHTVIVSVSGGGLISSTQIVINIIDSNNENPPTISSIANHNVSEALPVNSVVFRVTAIGNDGDADSSLTYTLNPNVPFSINSSGVVRVAQTLDYETTTRHISVLSVSDGVFTTTQLLTFTILNTNDNPPTIRSIANHNISEALPVNSVVFRVTAIGNDGDADSSLTYTLNPNVPFSINSSGVVRVAQTLDYETATRHISVLSVSDGLFITTQLLTFTILNTNDNPPTISNTSTLIVDSQVAVGSEILTLVADGNDGSADGSLSYFLSGNNSFAITGNKITVSTVLNFATTPQHTLLLSVSDGLFISTQLITIHVQYNEVLATGTFSIRQGVLFKGQWELPSGFSTNFVPQILSPLPANTTLAITNPAIREFSLLYGGSQSSFTLTYALSNGSVQTHSTGSVTFNVISYDPLRSQQWYLNNTGQSAFASIGGTAGADIRVNKVHEKNILGEGIQVAVVDEGLEITHEDLVDNVVAGGSYDFISDDNNPQPRGTNGDHGTSVAGLIAMRGWNNLGGAGVAPSASIVGYNFLSSQTFRVILTSMGFARAVSINTPSQNNRVFNMSFGSIPFAAIQYRSRLLDNAFTDSMRCATTGNPFFSASSTGVIPSSFCQTFHDNKGAVYIQSAGNSFNVCGPQGLSCHVVNGSSDEAHPYVIVVSSLNAEGKRASYSSVGPAVWVSAPGGEFGQSDRAFDSFNTRFSRNERFPDTAKKTAMITTDQSGCHRGYTLNSTNTVHNSINYRIPITPFHGTLTFASDTSTSIQSHPQNQNCNYASTFNGTSSAAPVTSGVAALMLSANNDLTWRDVRYILAKTARKIDPDVPAFNRTVADGRQLLRSQWSTNTANFAFHPWYGFGMVDADAAVTMAQSYTDFLTNNRFIQGEWIDGAFPNNSTITDNSINGVTGTVNVSSQAMRWIEGVQIRLSVTHPHIADISAKLISPSGTESLIVRAFNTLGGSDNYSDTLFYSNKFYRETTIDGEWRLVITDNEDRDIGRATDWKIRFFGERN